jgi:hypothetical protein
MLVRRFVRIDDRKHKSARVKGQLTDAFWSEHLAPSTGVVKPGDSMDSQH